MNKQFLSILIICLNLSTVFSQNITVDESYTAQNLIQDVLFANACSSASVSNVSVSGGNFASGEKSWGYFNGNGSSFPFEDGIILSTGKIANAPGPNTSLLEDGDGIGWGGDNDLQNALSISNSFNATILEFDFIPIGDKISFDYMLSSEQYLTNPASNQCNYTDGFAFLLKEAGTATYENLAVVPGTSIPVKINTVRGFGTICQSANEEYFDAFNNDIHPTNFNGQTKVLTAQANVIPGRQYHIKLVIADEGNYRYDSAIFLGGGSFNFGVDLGNDRTFVNQNSICYDESLILDATDSSPATYKWLLNGDPIPGEIGTTLSFSPPYNTAMNGTYEVIINEGGICEKRGQIKLDFAQNLTLNKTTYAKCDDDGVKNGLTYFNPIDIVNMTNDLYINLPSYYRVELFRTPTDTTPLAIPFFNSSPYSQVIYARITNSNCYEQIPITITVNVFELNSPNTTLNICEGQSTTLQAELGNSYLWNTNETTSSIIVDTQGTYTVEITSTDDCSTEQTFTVISSEQATITDILINDLSINNSAEIIVSGNGDYEYSLNGSSYQNSPFFSNLESGDYTAFVRDKNGCGVTTMPFYILDYPKYFTPNDDGYNDTWQIKDLEKRSFEASKIYIFDRYGKLLKQINSSDQGWNGTFNGILLPSSDYWFLLELTNGKTINGHFSLKR